MTATDRLDLSEGTFITPTLAQSRRRKGPTGANTWVAKLEGPSQRHTFLRTFLPRKRAWIGGHEHYVFELPSEGFYEYWHFTMANDWSTGGIVHIKNGRITQMSRAHVLAIFEIYNQ